MARIRSVHPGFFTDERLVSVSMAARMLFIGLGVIADDKGVFEWKPLTVKMKVFPGDSLDVAPLLAELSGVDAIEQYEVDGKAYGAIRNFRKFQKPKTPNDIYPLPDDLRSYVGLDNIIPEPLPQNGEMFPPKEEKSFQMEEGRGKREDIQKTNPSDCQKKPERQTKTKLPDDCPTAADKLKAEAYWHERHRPDLNAEDEAVKFRLHHTKHGNRMASWEAAWQTWYVNAPEFKKPPARGSPDALAAALDPNRKSIWDAP